MSAPAYYKHEWCKPPEGTADRAAVGTKGGSGAKSLRSAAEAEARAWAYWAYQDHGKGTFSKAQNSKAFSNAHGITGWQAAGHRQQHPQGQQVHAARRHRLHRGLARPGADDADPGGLGALRRHGRVRRSCPQSIVDRIKSTIRPLNK